MSGTFPSPEPHSEVNGLYSSPLCSQSLSFGMYEVYAVAVLGGETRGRIFVCRFFLCRWAAWVHKCQHIRALEAVASPGALQGFLQPSAYFPTLKSLSSGPAQSLCFLSSEFFFLFPFSLPALPQLAFFRYVVTVPLTHPCPMLLSQLFRCPRPFPLGPSPSLSLSLLLV